MFRYTLRHSPLTAWAWCASGGSRKEGATRRVIRIARALARRAAANGWPIRRRSKLRAKMRAAVHPRTAPGSEAVRCRLNLFQSPCHVIRVDAAHANREDPKICGMAADASAH